MQEVYKEKSAFQGGNEGRSRNGAKKADMMKMETEFALSQEVTSATTASFSTGFIEQVE